MRTVVIILLLISVFAVACSSEGTTDNLSNQIATENIQLDEIKIKEISLNPSDFSGVGRLEIIDEFILFSDKAYQAIFRFDKEGSFLKKSISQGVGPNDVNSILHFSSDRAGQFVILSDFNFHQFLNDTTKINSARYDFDSGNEFSKLENEPSGEYSEIYYLDWSSLNDNFLVVDENHFFTPIITEHPKLNALQHTEFYTDTYSIGKFDMNSGKLLKMGGKWPEIYLQNKFVPNLAGLSLSGFEDKLYASYQIAPMVHVFDEDLVLTAKFGVPGRNMNTNYRTTNTIEDAIDN